jgi:hypothetical protein
MNASRFLFDTSDGYTYLRQIQIYDKSDCWDIADILVHQGDSQKPIAYGPGSYLQNVNWYYIEMPEYLYREGNLVYPGAADNNYSRILAHEWVHYGLGSSDEYIDASLIRMYPRREGIPENISQGPDTIMNSAIYFTEMSTEKTYNEWTPPAGYQTTKQRGLTGVSSWETFFNTYKDHVWFDLDEDGVRDTSYHITYEAKEGPEINGVNYGGYCLIQDLTTPDGGA